MAGRQALALLVEVRIPLSQPTGEGILPKGLSSFALSVMQQLREEKSRSGDCPSERLLSAYRHNVNTIPNPSGPLAFISGAPRNSIAALRRLG